VTDELSELARDVVPEHALDSLEARQARGP